MVRGAVRCIWWCASCRGAARRGRGPAAKKDRSEPGSYITRPLDRDLFEVPNALYGDPCCAADHTRRVQGRVGGRPPPAGRTEVRTGACAGRRSPVRARRFARTTVRSSGVRDVVGARTGALGAVHRHRTVRTTGTGARTGCLDVPHLPPAGCSEWSPPDVAVEPTPTRFALGWAPLSSGGSPRWAPLSGRHTTLAGPRRVRPVCCDRVPRAGAATSLSVPRRGVLAARPSGRQTRGRPTDGWSVGRPDVAAVSSAPWP